MEVIPLEMLAEALFKTKKLPNLSSAQIHCVLKLLMEVLETIEGDIGISAEGLIRHTPEPITTDLH